MATLKIALVAHDEKKNSLLDWALKWETSLAPHTLIGTGSSATMIEERCPSLRV